MLKPVLDDVARLIASITPEQDKLPTPCDDFDVITLRLHLFGWLAYFDAAFTDPTGTERPDPAAYAGPDDAEALISALELSLEAGISAPAVGVPLLGGTYPGGVVADLLLIEALGHGWDLARATDRPWDPALATCEHALAVLRGVVQPEYRGPGLPFRAEVEVAADAPALDRMVAFTGRDPNWSAPR